MDKRSPASGCGRKNTDYAPVMSDISVRSQSRGYARGRLVVVGSVAAVILLAGCNSETSDEGLTPPEPEASSEPAAEPTPSASSSPEESPTGNSVVGAPCSLLDEASLTALIGTAPPGKEVLVTGSTLPACHFGDLNVLGVQVIQVPAAEWASALPTIVESIKALPAGAVDENVLQQLEDGSQLLAAGSEFSAEESCDYFSLMVEAQGAPVGSTQIVTFFPDQEDPIAVTGQRCISGQFTSLLVSRPDIVVDQGTYDQVVEALGQIG